MRVCKAQGCKGVWKLIIGSMFYNAYRANFKLSPSKWHIETPTDWIYLNDSSLWICNDLYSHFVGVWEVRMDGRWKYDNNDSYYGTKFVQILVLLKRFDGIWNWPIRFHILLKIIRFKWQNTFSACLNFRFAISPLLCLSLLFFIFISILTDCIDCYQKEEGLN